MNKQKRADLLLVMVTFFWGASYYLTNLCLTDLQPMNLNAFRFLSAFAVLGVVFLSEPVTVQGVCGALLILASLYIPHLLEHFGVRRKKIA